MNAARTDGHIGASFAGVNSAPAKRDANGQTLKNLGIKPVRIMMSYDSAPTNQELSALLTSCDQNGLKPRVSKFVIMDPIATAPSGATLGYIIGSDVKAICVALKREWAPSGCVEQRVDLGKTDLSGNRFLEISLAVGEKSESRAVKP